MNIQVKLRVGQTKLKLEVSTTNTNYEFKNITTEVNGLKNKLEFIHHDTKITLALKRNLSIV